MPKSSASAFLRQPRRCGNFRRDRRLPYRPRQSSRCRSSVVEHSLGKGEVDSSILSGSTRKFKRNQHLGRGLFPCPPLLRRERSANSPTKVGENPGTLFSVC